MALNFNIPKFAFNLPWFIFDIDNFQLITSPTIQDEIKDDKDIILSEISIPGLNFSPIMSGGAGNRKLSLNLTLVRRNNTVGNMLLLKQFDQLRQNASGFFKFSSEQFERTPRVLYMWGTGSIPLIYWVKKCNFAHRGDMINEMAQPQHSVIALELWLDETNILYLAEEIFRKLASLAGMAIGAYDVYRNIKGDKIY